MSKTDTVYAVLHRRIAAGEYSPGFRLVIDALSRELGVSPIPVREAIRRLEAEGWVQHQPNVGSQVAGMNDQEYAEIMTVLARMEGWVTAESSGHLTPEDLEVLSRLAHEMSHALELSQLERYGELSRLFHERIRERCPNRFLSETVSRIWVRLDTVRRNVFVSVPERARQSLQDHYHIIQSLREHAPKRVLETLVEEHQLRIRDAYLAHVGADADGPFAPGSAAPGKER